MSNFMYNKLWHEAQYDLEGLAVADFENQALDAQFDRSAAQKAVFEIYIKYIVTANKLEEIYDQIIQPQKRILIRNILDGCLGRIVELKHDLVNVDITEFNYNDDVIQKLRLTPLDIETRVPRYFKRERENEINQRKKFMDDILIKMGWLVDEEVEEEKLTEIEAIRVIQMHERARQGRLRAQFMKEIRMLKEKGKPEGGKDGKDGSGLMAAMKIQKMWRGFATRKKTRRRKMEEMILIGMVPPPPSKFKEEQLLKSEALTKVRYELQHEYFENYKKALRDTKDEINNRQGSVMTEDIADEVRNWFRDYQSRTGKLPDFPSEEAGGSRHLMSRQGTESDLSRSSAYSKESKKAKEKTKVVKSGDVNVEDNFESGFKASQSLFLPELKTGIDEFNEVWKSKDESQNPKQTHYEDMIINEKYTEVETELRKIVDDLMRQELELLQAALDRDRATKGKKAKKSSKKARRSGKKGKKKKEKDLTPDRTTESLFEELIMNGVIKKYPDTSLTSFLGDRSYTAREGTNPAPGDIRQVMMEYAVLPLGSEAVRNYAPCVRSILITGSKGSGKKLLVNAICSEIGGVLFDLTPANIAGKYPGKSGLIMLMHLVSKVSRLLQPSVIYMGDAEKPFMKKVPKTDKSDPKRLKKDLPKLIKNIGPEDRIIFIGTSSAPWEADQKLLQQTYNRFIYIPRPDYGTLAYAWKHLLGQYSGIQQHFDTGAMAKISDGYCEPSAVQYGPEILRFKPRVDFCSRVKVQSHRNPFRRSLFNNSGAADV